MTAAESRGNEWLAIKCGFYDWLANALFLCGDKENTCCLCMVFVRYNMRKTAETYASLRRFCCLLSCRLFVRQAQD